MDKQSFHQVGMEGGRVQMCSQEGPGPNQLSADFTFSRYSENRIAQSFQSPQIDWKMKAMDMPESRQATDYSDMNVSISRAKLRSQNLHLKIPGTRDEDVYMDCDSVLDDIDKKLATKKVVPPTETKDETAPVVDPYLNVQHKKRPQKRTITQAVDEQNASYYTLGPGILKYTHDVIQKIKEGITTNTEVCLSYNRQYFSSIRNLQVVPDARVASGSFGDVLRVRDSQTGKILTQKQVKKNSKGKFEIEKNEIEVPLQFADVENIARFLGLYWNGDKLLFIMEDAGISLRELITNQETCRMLSEPGRIEKIMLDVYRAISSLASNYITHCDIKPENICLNIKTWLAKLVDFGSCKTPQNGVDYKGTTPEYLDSVANKSLHEAYVLKNKQYPVHKLDEKDDVFAAGLVGLFLIKKVHPMIHFFTGCDTVFDVNTRLGIMKKISELTDGQMSQLLGIPMSDIMRELLQGVLALNRDKRWKAREAVYFLQEKLGSDVQPPNKLSRQEAQPCIMPADDLSMFVNLREKNSDRVVAPINRKCESPGSPGSPVVQGQGLGVVMKGPATSTQTGGILLHPKMKLSVQQQQMMSPPLQQLSRQPQYLGQVRQPVVPCGLSEQENKDYNDLVMSFREKTQMCQGHMPTQRRRHCAGTQQQDVQKIGALPVPVGNSQRIPFANPQTGQPLSTNPGPVQSGQIAARPILGLSGGRLFQVTGGIHLNPSEVCGNIPNIDDLMQSNDEPYRPKLKGRRSYGSQDEK